MNMEQYKGGIVFKWLNKKEIYNKYNGQGKRQNLQAYLDKLHQEYIAIRPGTDIGYSTHGLFGYICNTSEVEMSELEVIKNRVNEMSKKNIDVFKTVICLKEEDAIEHGMLNKSAWKNVLESTIFDITKEFKIPLEDLEWTASFHAKKGRPHCHLLIWNKNQNMEVRRKPFINFKNVKKILAKEIYKEELKALYEIKNISKKQLEVLSKDEINNYKESLKAIYDNEDLKLNIVDTEYVQLYVNNIMKNMESNSKIYIASKSNPQNYAEITKKNDEQYEFKNIGPQSILYKEKSYMETTQFLSNFEELCIFNCKEELEKYIAQKNNEHIDIENELKEILPTAFNIPIITPEINEENIEMIIKKLIELDKITNNYEKGFKYEYQTSNAKKCINEISTMLINTSKECKSEVETYIETCVNIDKVMQKVYKYEDYNKSREQANRFVMNKIGNQILKFVKETKTDEYKEKKQEWKDKREYWNNKIAQYEENKARFEQKQELYEKQWQMITIQNLLKDTFAMLVQENLSKTTNLKRKTKTFGDLSKREIKEMIKKKKSMGFDWYREL